MTALVIYDSQYGNTEKIARAIAAALGTDVDAQRVADVQPQQLSGVQLLVVGSPTQGGRPTKPTAEFLKAIPGGSLKGVRVAAFDTRIDLAGIKSGVLRSMAKLFGFAADRIASQLAKTGGRQAAAPEGFIVLDAEGPLKDGELDRAAAWAQLL